MNENTSPGRPSERVWRRNPLIHYRAITRLMDALVAADLSKSGYRLALNVISRMISREMTSEAIPIEWLAEKLGVHRNSITAAFNELAAAGILGRTPSLHRGAPTSTSARGLAKAVVVARAHTEVSPDAAIQDGTPQVTNAPLTKDPRCEHWRSGSASDTSSGVESGTRSGVTSGPPQKRLRAQDTMGTERAEHTSTEGQGRALTASPAFRFDAAIHRAMQAKVPAEAIQAALRSRQGTVAVDPDWGLTEREAEHFRRLTPPRESPARTTAPRYCRGASATKVVLPPDAACAAWSALPVLEALAGPKRAGELIDEIAYSVTAVNLGRGDYAGGVRAALAIIRKAKWTTPRGMEPRWRGAVMRSLNTHRHPGDAQPVVH